MKLTKFEHACVSLEQDNQLLIIDPGSFGELPEDILGVVAVVITHIHADHFSLEHLQKVIDVNPDVQIITNAEVASEIIQLKNVKTVQAGDSLTVGPFKLEFLGGKHAIIHDSMPVNQNIGILVNDSLYYPGDSFTLPEKPVKVLLAPVSAPWLKVAEVMDFVTTIKPELTIPTHDALLSDLGKSFTDNWLAGVAEKSGGKYQNLKKGESANI